eukprot:1144812-Pelagomonas_calceolata.AAC.7
MTFPPPLRCSNVHVCLWLHCQDCWHRNGREGTRGNVQCMLWCGLSHVVGVASKHRGSTASCDSIRKVANLGILDFGSGSALDMAAQPFSLFHASKPALGSLNHTKLFLKEPVLRKPSSSESSTASQVLWLANSCLGDSFNNLEIFKMYHALSFFTSNYPFFTQTSRGQNTLAALHPMKYAAMLAERMQAHGTTAWLINTGWTGGG